MDQGIVLCMVKCVENAKKINHWAKCCQIKFIQEATATDEHLMEAISVDKTLCRDDDEATVILKINRQMARGKIIMLKLMSCKRDCLIKSLTRRT